MFNKNAHSPHILSAPMYVFLSYCELLFSCLCYKRVYFLAFTQHRSHCQRAFVLMWKNEMKQLKSQVNMNVCSYHIGKIFCSPLVPNQFLLRKVCKNRSTNEALRRAQSGLPPSACPLSHKQFPVVTQLHLLILFSIQSQLGVLLVNYALPTDKNCGLRTEINQKKK